MFMSTFNDVDMRIYHKLSFYMMYRSVYQIPEKNLLLPWQMLVLNERHHCILRKYLKCLLFVQRFWVTWILKKVIFSQRLKQRYKFLVCVQRMYRGMPLHHKMWNNSPWLLTVQYFLLFTCTVILYCKVWYLDILIHFQKQRPRNDVFDAKMKKFFC